MHFLQGLRLANQEIVRLRNVDMKNLLNRKRLYLILDLDHTLLNSTLLFHMTSEEDYLKSEAHSLLGTSPLPLIIDFLILFTIVFLFVDYVCFVKLCNLIYCHAHSVKLL